MKILVITLIGASIVHGLCYARDLGCNDEEMYQQCNKAQLDINGFAYQVFELNKTTFEILSLIPNFECEKNIWCQAWSKYCQNMNAYDKCVGATAKLNKFIADASRYVDIPEKFVENKPVIDYCKKDDRKYIQSAEVNDFYENSSCKISISMTIISALILALTY